jgi:hypothetical protein
MVVVVFNLELIENLLVWQDECRAQRRERQDRGEFHRGK